VAAEAFHVLGCGGPVGVTANYLPTDRSGTVRPSRTKGDLVDDFDVTIQLEGDEADGGDVRLETLLTELQAFKGLVRAAEETTGHEAVDSVGIRVVDLKHSSPAAITVDLFMLRPGPDPRPRIIEAMGTAARAILDPGAMEALPHRVAEAVQSLADPVAKGRLRRVVLTVAKSATTITKERALGMAHAIARAEEEVEGSFIGRLEAINLHGDRRFTIYPALGPKSLQCRFSKSLTKAAIGGVDQRVEVSGRLKYRPHESFPHEIVVREIRVLPDETDLPSWDDMRGLNPDATGGQTSEDFVRRLRDEW